MPSFPSPPIIYITPSSDTPQVWQNRDPNPQSPNQQTKQKDSLPFSRITQSVHYNCINRSISSRFVTQTRKHPMEDYSRTKSNSQRTTFFNRYSSISSSSSTFSTRSPPDAATRSTSPTRVTLGRSVSPSPSVRFSAPKPLQSRKSINQSHQIHQSPKIKSKKTCMCSPTTHPGSFRCSLHKGSLVPGYNIGNRTSSYRSGVQLNMRRSAMTNSLVRIGTVEGELVKRALAALIRPSLHNLRRRGEFQPRPSRLSVMSKAEDEI